MSIITLKQFQQGIRDIIQKRKQMPQVGYKIVDQATYYKYYCGGNKSYSKLLLLYSDIGLTCKVEGWVSIKLSRKLLGNII